VKSKKIWI